MPMIRVPDFTAAPYFKAGPFHIETKRFARSRVTVVFLIPSNSIPKNLFAYLRSETADQTIADVYRVEPIDSRTPVRYYTVWLGGTPVRVLQVESISSRTKAVVKISYQTVSHGSDQWLLPQKNPHPAGLSRLSDQQRQSGFRWDVRRLNEMSGEGDIFITYADWRVNTGLEDRFFQADNKRIE